MTPTLTFWLVIIVLAVGTWAMRSLPIMLHGHVPVPPWAERLLRYVPVAALTAIAVPASLYKANGVYHLEPPRILAAAAAMLVAVRTKNVVATLAVGMGVLWVAQLALPRLFG